MGSLRNICQWISNRAGILYIFMAIFIFTCVDVSKTIERVKARRLNDSRPNFSELLLFNEHKISKQYVSWRDLKNYFQLILSYIPNEPTAQLFLGYVYTQEGNLQKAAEYFQQSLESPMFFWSHFNLGLLEYQQQHYSQAIENLLAASSFSTDMTIKFMEDSIIYRQIFFSQKFRPEFNQGIRNAKAQALLLIIAACEKIGNYPKMLEFSIAAMEQNLPYMDAYYFYAGRACLELNQWDKAVAFFDKSLKLDKNNPMIYLYLSKIYKSQGADEQAQELQKIFLLLNAKNGEWAPYDKNIQPRFF